MNSVGTLQKRLHDETAAVEKDIESHHQQVEASADDPEGLKRAAELFDSEQAAIAELLQAGTANGGGIPRQISAAPAAKMQKAALSTKATTARKQVERTVRLTTARPRRHPTLVLRSNNGGLTRVEMIGAVLRRHPRRTVRELIPLLDREYHWTTTERSVTGHLYIHRDSFWHFADCATNRPSPGSSSRAGIRHPRHATEHHFTLARERAR